jgi:diguanylate cyclase (GGDEF)-like protein
MAAVNFVDAERHFTKAAVGAPQLRGSSLSNQISLCAATVRSPEGLLVISDASDPSWRGHCLVAGAPDVGFYAGAAIFAHGQPVGVICAFGPDARVLGESQIQALLALARQASGHLEQRRRNTELRNLSVTDSLTGLANRRLLFESLEIALAERRRGADAVGVLFCDVDGFKSVNDRFGHAVGDQVLCEIARRLRDAVRETDVVARIAGDEFVIVCPRLSGPEALALTADRARASAELPFPGPIGRLRLSVGAALALEGEKAADLLLRADVLMYADKSAHAADGPEPAEPTGPPAGRSVAG